MFHPLDFLLFVILHFLFIGWAIRIILRIRDRLWLPGFLQVDPLAWHRATSAQDRQALLRQQFQQAMLKYQYRVLAFLRSYYDEHHAAPAGQRGEDDMHAFLWSGQTRVMGFCRRATVRLPYAPTPIADVDVQVLAVVLESGESIIEFPLPQGLPDELQSGLAMLLRANQLLVPPQPSP